MTDRIKQRQTATAEILGELENELDYVLATAAIELHEATRKEIKEESMASCRNVLAALSREELQNSSACEEFLQTTLAHARMKVNSVMFVQSRKLN